MPRPYFSRWQRRLFTVSALGLGLTGLGQMPIFSRFYVADIPGLGWLGDFRMTAILHLALAAVFLFFLGMYVVAWTAARAARPAPPFSLDRPARGKGARVLAVLCLGVGASGLIRVMQNQDWAFVGPSNMRWLDWSHLFLAMALGFVALWTSLAGRNRRRSPKGEA